MCISLLQFAHNHTCKCCTGNGIWTDVVVQCGEEKTNLTVEVMEFLSCGCKQCGDDAISKLD